MSADLLTSMIGILHFVRFDERVQKFDKEHPIWFNPIPLGLGLVAFGILELIESVFRWFMALETDVFAALSHFLVSLLRRASLYVEPAEESAA
jgi:hypothetical protein